MFLFVYGTLKLGHCRSHLLTSQKFVVSTKTKEGYKIYNCGGFPGLVKGNGIVEGEIWDVKEEYIDFLDKIEGSPYLYKLEPIKTEDLEKDVFAYFWQKTTKGLKECGTVWKVEFGED